jgi:predicted glycoside hydrolase/deacetylase ChbG (UPF0249 family)
MRRQKVPKYLIVNADDLGISVSVNLAIRQALVGGMVTSASLLANMPAFQHAVETVIRPNPALGIGAHLCLTSGRPALPPERIPLLADARGARFRLGFVGLWRLLRGRHREEALRQIRDEWTAQVDRIEASGVAIDHLDGHQHVHMIPELFDLAAAMARARRVGIRIAGEPFRLRQRGPIGVLRCLTSGGIVKNLVLAGFAKANRRRWPDITGTDHYFGALDTGGMTLDRLRSILGALSEGITEVTVHPGLEHVPISLQALRNSGPTADGAAEVLPQSSRQDLRFLGRREAAEELAALLDPSLRGVLTGQGIKLVRFGDVADCRSSASRARTE